MNYITSGGGVHYAQSLIRQAIKNIVSLITIKVFFKFTSTTDESMQKFLRTIIHLGDAAADDDENYGTRKEGEVIGVGA